jgi:aspartate aminotransferase
MKAAGERILNFAVGEPDFATPQEVIDKTIQSLHEKKTKYGAAGGGMPLREATVQKLASENKLNYKPEQIVFGMGAKEILFHLCLTLIDDGDEVLIPAPYWVSYTEQIKAAGGIPVVIPMADGERPIAPKTWSEYVTEKTVGIMLNSPNNPTGYVFNEVELFHIKDFLEAHKNLWAISDEIYEYLTFVGTHKSILNLCPEDLNERLILVHGLSKGYAMTGYRVGYMAGPLAVAKQVRSFQSHSSTCLPPFIEDAATYALSRGRDLLTEEFKTLNHRRQKAVAILVENNIPHVIPEGAFYLFIDARKYLKENSQKYKDTLALCDVLLTEYKMAIVPGEAFGAPGFMRFSYASSMEDIEAGLGVLSRVLNG